MGADYYWGFRCCTEPITIDNLSANPNSLIIAGFGIGNPQRDSASSLQVDYEGDSAVTLMSIVRTMFLQSSYNLRRYSVHEMFVRSTHNLRTQPSRNVRTSFAYNTLYVMLVHFVV